MPPKRRKRLSDFAAFDAACRVDGSTQQSFTSSLDDCLEKVNSFRSLFTETGSVTSTSTSSLSRQEKDFILFSCLGCEGARLLSLALAHVPETFVQYRWQYISDIINHWLTDTEGVQRAKAISAEDVERLAALANDTWSRGSRHGSFAFPTSCDFVDLLWCLSKASAKNYLYFLAPPSTSCCDCGSQLSSFHEPTNVTLYLVSGPVPASKITLRCRNKDCDASTFSPYYYTSVDGSRFYEDDCDFVEASTRVYVHRELHRFQAALAHHSWVSFSGFAEAYNEAIHCSMNYINMKDVLASRTRQGQSRVSDLIEEEEEENIDSCSAESHPVGLGVVFTRKVAASAFWAEEVKSELKEHSLLHTWAFNRQRTFKDFMEYSELERVKYLYKHENCSKGCEERGCGRLFTTDGLWKLIFSHCMFKVPMKIAGFPNLNFPDVCTKETEPGSAFCLQHCQQMKGNKIPTTVRGFLEYARKSEGASAVFDALLCNETEQVQDAEVEGIYNEVEVVLDKLASEASDENTVAEEQGTQDINGVSYTKIIQSSNEKGESVLSSETSCKKNLGSSKQLRKWSKGHQFVVSGGGMILTYIPLYKSESLSQVFLLLLRVLFLVLQDVPAEDWSKVIVCYDAMCLLNNLRAAQVDLPLPEPYNKMWQNITKIIDAMHLKNHKNPKCKERYNPEPYIASGGKATFNTMCAEQTFVWAGRFKKILCAMPKHRHLFYLHRMVKRRNKYTELCYANNRKPVLPVLRGSVTQ